MSQIALSLEHAGCIEVYDVDDESRSIFIQSDWDYPGMAMLFGWSPCHNCTDGTVACRECGKSASDLISNAYDFMAAREGEVIESVCFNDYF